MRIHARRWFLLISFVFFGIGLFYLGWSVRDRAWLAAYARDVVARAGAVTARDRVMALRDDLRATVDYRKAEHDNRPYLRDTPRQTIESGRGYCGESTRALLALARAVGIRGQRVNLYGDRLNHVVAELELEPGRLILVDAQNNPEVNAYFDHHDRTLDEVIGAPDAWFRDYSNINLRRAPIVGRFLQRVRTHQTWLTDLMEDPHLLLFLLGTMAGLTVPAILGFDLLFLRMYARRLGMSARKGMPELTAAPLSSTPGATVSDHLVPR